MIQIKWFPPSWFQIKTGKKILYIDPAYLKTYFKDYPHKVEFSTWPDEIDGLPEKNLEKADIILITHHHKDHCKHVTVNRLKKGNTQILAPEMCANDLNSKYTVVKPGEEYQFEEVKVRVVQAYNTPEGHSTRKIHKKDKSVGYLIQIGDKTIYHAGDTDLIPEMDLLGEVDLALIPIGGTFTMDIPEAVDAVKKIRPKTVIPMHMKEADPMKFKKLVEGQSDTEVLPLEIGGEYQLGHSKE